MEVPHTASARVRAATKPPGGHRPRTVRHYRSVSYGCRRHSRRRAGIHHNVSGAVAVCRAAGRILGDVTEAGQWTREARSGSYGPINGLRIERLRRAKLLARRDRRAGTPVVVPGRVVTLHAVPHRGPLFRSPGCAGLLVVPPRRGDGRSGTGGSARGVGAAPPEACRAPRASGSRDGG